MAKRKNSTIKKKEDKEEESLNTWIPIGLMLGLVMGFLLFDDILYLGISTAGGLLLGIVLSSIFGEQEIKFETKKKRKRKTKSHRTPSRHINFI